MDHPVKPSVKKLAASLMDNVPTNWADALSDLDALSELTTQAFEPENPPHVAAPEASSPAQTTTPTQSAANSTPQAPATQVSVPERYEGVNLKDQQVLDALLAYHRMHAPVLGATTGPKPAKNSSRNVFSPMEIPIIEAAPKSKAAHQAGSSGYSSSILKPSKK